MQYLLSILMALVVSLAPTVLAAQPQPIPPGYEEKCHSQTFKSTMHCHVVPKGTEASWQPGEPSTIALQVVGGLVGLLVIGGGMGMATYVGTGGNFREVCIGCQTAGIVVGSIGAFFGMGLGVWGAGELDGGDGSLLLTLVGALGFGCLGSIGAYYLSADHVFEDELFTYEQYPHTRQVTTPERPVFGPFVRFRF